MRSAGRAAAILIVCALFAAPLVLMALGSLRVPGLPPPDGFELLPSPLRPQNYQTVGAFIDLGRMFANSLIVVAVAVPVTVLLASWGGYAIATARPRTRRWLVALSLVALMIPTSALWVPRFALYRWLGLTDTLFSLMAPALMATTPFYVLVFALVYSRIPRSLYDAARLDGLSPLQIWRKVAAPLGASAAFAVAVLAFVFHWSNFVDPLLYLSASELATLPLGLKALHTLEPTNHPIFLAASVLVTLPPVVAFLLAQRAFFTRTLEV